VELLDLLLAARATTRGGAAADSAPI